MTKGKKKNNVIKEIHSIEQQLYGKAMMIVGISLLLTLSSCEKDDDDIDDPEPVTEIVDETVDQMASYPGGIPALMWENSVIRLLIPHSEKYRRELRSKSYISKNK